jgi:hypothetical protein
MSFTVSNLIVKSWGLFAKRKYVRIVYYCATKSVFQKLNEEV